ncbi:hypothetical protein ABIE50_000657 [Chitinophaga sp. OAE865]
MANVQQEFKKKQTRQIRAAGQSYYNGNFVEVRLLVLVNNKFEWLVRLT